MSNSNFFIDKMVEGDKNRQRIYDYLIKKSASRRVACEDLKLSKSQFVHYIDFLIDNYHVKKSIGVCEVYGNKKVQILYSNPDFPFKARTKKQITEEKNKKEEYEELIKKHTRVIRNLDRPGSDFSHQRKKFKTDVNIQSSLNSI